jgi:RNA-binding protein
VVLKGPRAKAARAAGQSLEPTVFVGRGGVTDAVAAELKLQLRTHDLVKARLPRAATQEASALAADLARRSSADLVEVRGFTALFAVRRASR